MADEKNMPQTGGEENKKIKLNFGGAEIEAAVDKNGQIIMPREIQEIMAAGMAVMQKAAAEANDTTLKADENNGGVQAGTAAEAFKGLPMRDLIGAPLFAAAEAQEKLASIAWDYYQRIAYDTDKDGKPTNKTRVLEFDLERPVVQDGVVGGTMNQKVKAPFIGLVPIPSLLIDNVDVDFQMEVTDTNTSTNKESAEASTNISSRWFGVNVQVSGKVSTSRENTRSTNQTAKYQVHVSASQQPPTEGLSKLMDIMASCIEPVPTESK